MELFDTTGTGYYRNVLWMIGLALVGVCITYSYKKAVRREKLEATYSETIGYVTSVDRWKRTRTRNGSVESTSYFYKFSYQYFVNGKLFGGSAQQKEEPSDTIPIYYNSKDPATHVLKRKDSENELVILIVGGIVVLAFIGVNVYLYKSKKKKISNCYTG